MIFDGMVDGEDNPELIEKSKMQFKIIFGVEQV